MNFNFPKEYNWTLKKTADCYEFEVWHRYTFRVYRFKEKTSSAMARKINALMKKMKPEIKFMNGSKLIMHGKTRDKYIGIQNTLCSTKSKKKS